jgi:hypothetical protein
MDTLTDKFEITALSGDIGNRIPIDMAYPTFAEFSVKYPMVYSTQSGIYKIH